MSKIIDLTMPLEDHLRWPVDRKQVQDFGRGDQFQVTWAGWAIHGFTHMDAPRHMLPTGQTTSDIALETVVGECAVFDLTGIADNTPITAERLANSVGVVKPGDIALIKAEWDTRYANKSADFWTNAPYLTQEAAHYLLETGVKSVAFDFPQDYPIRLLLKHEVAPIEDFVTHHILLRNNVILIEYLCNTAALQAERPTLYCLPLKLPDADGAPARVIAVEAG